MLRLISVLGSILLTAQVVMAQDVAITPRVSDKRQECLLGCMMVYSSKQECESKCPVYTNRPIPNNIIATEKNLVRITE